MPPDVALTCGHTFPLCDCIIGEDETPDGEDNSVVVELRRIYIFLPF